MKNNKDNNHNHLKNSEIDIEKRAKGAPFKVPDGYFDELPAAINVLIDEQQSVKTINLNKYRIVLSVAAVLVAVVVAVWYLDLQKKDTQINQVSLTYEDIIESGMVSDYDESMIVNHFDFSDSESENLTEADDYIDEYKDYLIRNNVDINILINEL